MNNFASSSISNDIHRRKRDHPLLDIECFLVHLQSHRARAWIIGGGRRGEHAIDEHEPCPRVLRRSASTGTRGTAQRIDRRVMKRRRGHQARDTLMVECHGGGSQRGERFVDPSPTRRGRCNCSDVATATTSVTVAVIVGVVGVAMTMTVLGGSVRRRGCGPRCRFPGEHPPATCDEEHYRSVGACPLTRPSAQLDSALLARAGCTRLP